jgi:ABC-type glycerol-3-phosphate transport system substrate-binding protein
MEEQGGRIMTNKLSSILAKSIGVRPVAKYGQTEPKLTNTNVEGIWSVEYCRQNPEQAAQAIEALQWMIHLHDQQDQSTANILKSIANDLMEVQKLVRL